MPPGAPGRPMDTGSPVRQVRVGRPIVAGMKPITEVARALGIDLAHLEPYGHWKAKLSHAAFKGRPTKGKLVLVSAITPTPAGEGKTTTSVGLAQGLARIGVNAAVALREPSLGPTFGVKGGGAGGGASGAAAGRHVPAEDAVCPPGRQQSAAGDHSRQRA